MASIPVTAAALAAVKKALRREYPDVSSSHLTEALAAALGRRTHAALLADLPRQADDPNIELLDDEHFDARLQEFGYPADPEFSFELLIEMPSDIITTMSSTPWPLYEYRTKRQKAWRNLLVAAINEGIRQKLFSLRPGDNRWPGAEMDPHGPPSGALFDFTLPNGLPVRAYVSDAGFDELSIHAAVNPKGDWVKAYNAEFSAGDAFATTWLERAKGAWMQSSTDAFNCRKALIDPLASMNVRPLGFGDIGKVM